jgi:hypothetical protein
MLSTGLHFASESTPGRPDGLSVHCTPDVKADAVPDASALVRALEAYNETLKADGERLEAMLAAQQARTSTAIAAFAALAERLDALAAEWARPWWRRLGPLKWLCPLNRTPPSRDAIARSSP